jgi:HD superfamily phosphohydrolase
MWQIVHNETNGIDVDKFDYLCRDCYSASLPLGFDFKRIMELSRVSDEGEVSNKY